jgi:hypothetical protein
MLRPLLSLERLSLDEREGRVAYRPIRSKGWAEMIRKVFEVDPMVCPKCG